MKNSVIAVVCPNQGECTNPEALRLACKHQGPTFINASCQTATNLVDQDRGGGNDRPQPKRSEL